MRLDDDLRAALRAALALSLSLSLSVAFALSFALPFGDALALSIAFPLPLASVACTWKPAAAGRAEPMGDCISATGERRQCKGTFAFAAAEPHHVDLARKSRKRERVCLFL